MPSKTEDNFKVKAKHGKQTVQITAKIGCHLASS